MSTDRLLLVGALLLVALGVVALLGGDPAEEADVDEVMPGDPVAGGALEGRKAEAPAKPKIKLPEANTPLEHFRNEQLMRMAPEERERWLDRVEVSGIVVTATGEPVGLADVYQLDTSKAAGAHRNFMTPVTRSDASGRFTLKAMKPLAESMIVAAKARFAPGFVPGAEIGPGHEIRIVLPAPTMLHVYLVDTAGKPVANEGIRAVPAAWRGHALPLPGPGSPLKEKYEGTDENGRASFYFSRSTPVTVIPDLEGWVSDPLERWLPDSDGTVYFTVQRGATIVVEAQDVKTGARIEQTVWVSVLDRESGRELTAGSSAEANGVMRTDLPLLPGYYDVLVRMRGREPLLVADVQVPSPGAEVKVPAKMGPLKEAATVQLALPDPVPARKGAPESTWSRQYPPVVFVQRSDGNWQRHGWTRRTDGKMAFGASPSVTLTLRPGEYDVLVADPNSGTCAHTTGLQVEAGVAVEPRIAYRGGLQFPLYETLPVKLGVRRIRVEVAGVGTFTAYGYNPTLQGNIHSQGHIESSVAPASSPLRSSARLSPQLGPYPGGSATLVVTDWEGTTHRFPIRRK